MPLRVHVVTPEREVTVADDATFVLAHGIEGDVGILPGHAPLMIGLGIGPLKIAHGDRAERMLVDGGFLQVNGNNVIVLAEYAVLPDEVDAAALPVEIEEMRRRLQAAAQDETLQHELARREAVQRLVRLG
jgi:F-type H+-transporting ATPase subunit epsilon